MTDLTPLKVINRANIEGIYLMEKLSENPKEDISNIPHRPLRLDECHQIHHDSKYDCLRNNPRSELGENEKVHCPKEDAEDPQNRCPYYFSYIKIS
jgi:hypothetical protein